MESLNDFLEPLKTVLEIIVVLQALNNKSKEQ